MIGLVAVRLCRRKQRGSKDYPPRPDNAKGILGQEALPPCQKILHGWWALSNGQKMISGNRKRFNCLGCLLMTLDRLGTPWWSLWLVQLVWAYYARDKRSHKRLCQVSMDILQTHRSRSKPMGFPVPIERRCISSKRIPVWTLQFSSGWQAVFPNQAWRPRAGALDMERPQEEACWKFSGLHMCA